MMIEFNQTNIHDIIFELKQTERTLRLIDDKNRCLAKVGLTIQLYYQDGATPTGKQLALNIVHQFKEKYKDQLVAIYSQLNRGFVKLNDKSYQKFLNFASKNTEANTDILRCYLSSDETGELQDDYVIEIYTAYPDSEPATEPQLSYLGITLPLELLETEQGRQEYQHWIDLVVSTLNVFHGYAGLSLKLPYDRHPFQSYEYEITRQNWGITPDGKSFSKRDWKKGLKSISWQTFVGRKFKDKVTQQPYYQTFLKNYPEVQAKEINQCLILKAGNIPQAGYTAKPLPISYLVVNELCRPVLTKTPLAALHTGNQGPLYSYTQTYYWLNRWNNDNFENGLFNSQGTKQELLHVLGQDGYENEAIPFSGIWKPFRFKGISEHFKAGDAFPEEGKYIRQNGEISKTNAVWCLEKRDDFGPILLPNPFKIKE